MRRVLGTNYYRLYDQLNFDHDELIKFINEEKEKAKLDGSEVEFSFSHEFAFGDNNYHINSARYSIPTEEEIQQEKEEHERQLFEWKKSKYNELKKELGYE